MTPERQTEIKRLYEEISKFRVAARYSNWQLSHDQVDQILFALRDSLDALAEQERISAAYLKRRDEYERAAEYNASYVTERDQRIAALEAEVEQLQVALQAACELHTDGRAYFRTTNGLRQPIPIKAERLVRRALKGIQEVKRDTGTS